MGLLDIKDFTDKSVKSGYKEQHRSVFLSKINGCDQH